MNWPQDAYVALMCCPAVVYAVVCCALGFADTDYDTTIFYCMPPTAFAGKSLNFWILTNLLICASVVVVVVYSVAYVKAKRLGKQAQLQLWYVAVLH